MEKRRILVIEDEKPIADILNYGFEKEGFTVFCAFTGADGLRAAKEKAPDLVLLDWMLPDISGVDVCRLLTERRNIPILMLTARDNVEDKLYGLESGADDYVTKPFDLREVTARVHTILRRFERAQESAGEAFEKMQMPSEELRELSLVVSEEEHTVYRNGKQIELTPREFDLLAFFVKHPRQVFTRTALLDRIWGYDYLGDTRTVDIHIQRLRKKADLGEQLITVFGVGYKYVP